MIALTCSSCGHEQEVKHADRSLEIRCVQCGKLFATEEAATVRAKPHNLTTADSGPDSRNEETLAGGPPSKPIEHFTFLTPAKGDGELGWLKHYRVIRLLGQGGMGVVFEAVDTRLQRTVALKVMKPEIASDELARQRFEREARATAAVKSDFIVVIHDVDKTANIPYLAMEFLQGEPLDKWLARRQKVNLQEAVRIGIEIARGLAAAHEKGLIHRDIKPGNIWLETEDRVQTSQAPSHRYRVKILDFGLARNDQEKTNLTQTGLVLGTPAYMAPEQAEANEVDFHCDLFSLGCVLYELATGALPFSGANTMAVLMAVAMKAPKPPVHLNPDLPPALSEVILHLLAKNPKDRPESARLVADALEGVAADMGMALQTPSSGMTRLQRSGVKPAAASGSWFGGLAIGAALFGMLLLALISWIFFKPTPPPPPPPPAADIVFGMSGPFSGQSKELGAEMQIGINTYFGVINDQGGVNGHRLKLTALDDGYEPDRALANMKKLKDEHKVFGVVGNIGTPTGLVTMPYAVENKMLFYGPFTGAKLLRNDPPDRYVFHYRANYEEETAAIVNYLLQKKELQPEEIAVFAQTDQYGDAGFGGVVKALKPRGRKEHDILRVGYTRNMVDVEDAVEAIVKHKEIRAVVMVPTYRPAAAFIKQLKQRLAKTKRDVIFTNVSFVGSEALAQELGPGSPYIEGVIVTQVVPPVTSNATVVQQYREHLKKYNENATPSFSSLEGYIATKLLVEGLKKAGPEPTPEGLIDALESLHDVDLGTGVFLSFGPSRHQASHKVWGTRLTKDGVFEVLDLE